MREELQKMPLAATEDYYSQILDWNLESWGIFINCLYLHASLVSCKCYFNTHAWVLGAIKYFFGFFYTTTAAKHLA